MKLSLVRCCLVICTMFALLFGVFGVASTEAALTCTDDVDGANDEPNQKDLTGFCKGTATDLSCAASFDFGINWNWDDTGLSGTNTGDACALFDTDDDTNANFALCVTIGGSSAAQLTGSPRLYSCGNTRPDRCTNAVQDTSFNSTCTVDQDSAPPFSPSASCKGTDCATKDARATCCIDLDDFGGAAVAILLDTCSYPSQQPNSDPSDCIVTQECRTASDCTAAEECQDAECGTDGLCRYPDKEDGTSCSDDEDACTEPSTCQGGVCTPGGAPECPPAADPQCQAAACDPLTGCGFVDLDGSCDDSNACTTNDTCSSGACVGGSPPNCDDSNVCTDDSCNSATGCVNTNNTNPCDDSNACTTGDTCSGGSCVGGSPPNCDDSNVCTDDSCNSATGCVHTNNTAPCTDGNACTNPDVCRDGVCVSGGPVNIPG